ncbi:MAG: LacI family DNA-binding transcriptional regulator [Arachnia sp.]
MAGIQDVAARAGVSPSTVSYVLSGRRTISEPTRKRVLAAVEELNYRPHAGARALASARTQVLGLVAPFRPGVDIDVIMQFVAGVTTRSRDHDYDVLLLTETDASGIERVAQRSMADGFIVMDVESADPRLAALEALTQPSVLLGMPDAVTSLMCVDFDFEAAGALAVEHLHRAGQTRVALIGSPEEVLARGTSYAVRLKRGFDRRADELGMGRRALPCPADPLAAARLAADVLAADPDLGGIVVHNEAALPGILEAVTRLDRPVEVVALGPKAALAGKALTPIDIPGAAIGAAAVDLLIDLLVHKALPQRRLVAPAIGLPAAG